MSVLGELITTASDRFTAQARTLGAPPELGAFVVAGDAVAVVTRSETAPFDPARRTVALRDAEGADLGAEHPELASLLRTTFEARIIGAKGRPVLPATPPPLHARVESADGAALVGDFAYIHHLADESPVLLATHLARVCPDEGARIRAGQALAAVLAGDTEKLRLTLDLLHTYSR